MDRAQSSRGTQPLAERGVPGRCPGAAEPASIRYSHWTRACTYHLFYNFIRAPILLADLFIPYVYLGMLVERLSVGWHLLLEVRCQFVSFSFRPNYQHLFLTFSLAALRYRFVSRTRRI